MSAVLFSLTAVPARATDPPPGYSLSVELRQIADDLTNTVRRFQADLDREISLHDRGYRAANGRRIPGADVEIGDGPADIAQECVRKLMAARMIGSRRPGYEPAPVADADRIQALIARARVGIGAASDIVKGFLTVSAQQLNSPPDAELKVKYRELMKARAAVTDAAKKALVALPIPLPEGDTAEELREKAWDLLTSNPPSVTHKENALLLPIRVPREKKLTLIYERFRRVALIDSGFEDRQGRRLFYEEEWVERLGDTIVRRWAVAVDPATGQHTMLRRYAFRELSDTLDEIYHGDDPGDAVSRAQLTELSADPSRQGLALALLVARRSREELGAAVAEFTRQRQEALARNDELLTARNKLPTDDGMSPALRVRLFAIRAHLTGTGAMLKAENEVRNAQAQAAAKIRTLEALAAWASGRNLAAESPDSRGLLKAFDESDAEITSTRHLEREAIEAMPPDASATEAQFPALMKDTIIRMRGAGGYAVPDGAVRLRQEVWRLAGTAKGGRQVDRTIVLIDVDPVTGRQIPVSREVRYYPLEPADNLESIYDEFAAQ